MNESLFKRTVKLAHAKPELRDALLPIIKKHADMWAEEDELEAGRTWNGQGGKAYDSPPSPGQQGCYGESGGKGKPGEGATCYRIHNEYGSGASKDKKEYNKNYREKWMDGHNSGRSTCPDGRGGKTDCGGKDK